MYIYILKLENDKYYVGRTANPTVRIKKHYESYGSAWTSKYKPVETLEVIPGCDNYDEDKITKQYMDKYGIDNVRGGSYCQLELTEEQKRFIEKEIKNVKNVCYNCGETGHFITRCPNKNKKKCKDNKNDKNDKNDKNKSVNIDELDLIEKKEYENGFVGIVDFNKDSSDSDCSDSDYSESESESEEEED